MIELTQEVINDKIKIAHLNCPFNEGKKVLEDNGYYISSLKESILVRINKEKDCYISQNGNRVKEDILHFSDKEAYFSKDYFTICENVEEATACHKDSKEFYLTEEQIEKYKLHAIKIPNKNLKIPTNRFKEDLFTDFAFGNLAEQYGYFLLKEAKIEEMTVYLSDLSDKLGRILLDKRPFVRKIWFGGIGSGSTLFNSHLGLHHPYLCLGIKND